jgi:glycosyltransferase involved in cell wall biosynthesis
VRVLYLHQYFATRAGLTGTRSYEFSRYLLSRGHRMTMITSGRHNIPELTVMPGRDYIEAEVEGIRVVAIDAAYNNPLHGTGLSGWRRMREFAAFADLAARVGRRLERPDVVFATSTPLTIGLPGMKLARYFGVPFVFEIRDLWPQALINIGAIRNPLAIWWMRRLERRLYRAASHIIALSPGMKAGIVAAGTPSDRVTVIPNGCDLDLFRPDLDGSPARKRLNLNDAFVATYFGAMGKANGLEYVVEAARILQERGNKRIRVVLHGFGGCRTALEDRVRDYRLCNVIFSDPLPDKSAVAELVASSNVCLTIYAVTGGETTWSPNKMFDALAAGRPVLINVPDWLGDTIEQNGCGRFVDPRRPEALADALEDLERDRAKCIEMGRRSRALAEREFARTTLAARMEQVLLAAVGS